MNNRNYLVMLISATILGSAIALTLYANSTRTSQQTKAADVICESCIQSAQAYCVDSNNNSSYCGNARITPGAGITCYLTCPFPSATPTSIASISPTPPSTTIPPTPSPTIPPIGGNPTITLTSLPPGASGGPSYNGYLPGLAFDGNGDTWWVGDFAQTSAPAGEWNLYYNYQSTKVAGSTVTVIYLDGNYPASATLQFSVDGSTWFPNPGIAIPNQVTTSYTAEQNFSYLRLRFFAPSINPPAIREIQVATPNQPLATITPTSTLSPTTPTPTSILTPTPTSISPTRAPGTTNMALITTLTGTDYTVQPRGSFLATVELLNGSSVVRTFLSVPFTKKDQGGARQYQGILYNIPNGTYSVRVKPIGYLSRTSAEITTGLSAEETVLIAPQCSAKNNCIVGGDLTEDDLVDIADFTNIVDLVRNNFCDQREKGAACSINIANINLDSNVDIFDFQTEVNLIRENKNTHGDTRADSFMGN